MTTEDSPSKPAPTFDFAKEKVKIDELIGQWSDEDRATTDRRDIRVKKTNVQEDQIKGKLNPNEIFIPRRIVDRNIRQEKPAKLAYIEQSPRLVLFNSRTDYAKDTLPLADWFARGMRYSGWNEPWHRLADATSLHGGAALEIRVDPDKPLGFSLEYTPREDLIFPRKLRDDIQRAEYVARRYQYLPNELEDFIEAYEFDEAAVNELLQRQKDHQRSEPITVYRVFKKTNGIISCAWYSADCASKFLKDYEEFSLGMLSSEGAPLPATIFPFVFDLYELIEQQEVLQVKGRAFRDVADQDALSWIWTSTVNGANTAAEIERCYVNDPTAPESAQNEPYKPGTIHRRELKYNQAAYPDPMLLQVAQQLSTENLAASGQIDYAASNRKDSRKTRAEILTSRAQKQELTSVNIIPLALTIVRVYGIIWEVVQSQVLYAPKPLVIVPEGILPFFEDEYELVAAGSVEVVQRDEEIASLEAALPMFLQTPLGNEMLARYVELRFPSQAIRWKGILQQQDPRLLLAQFFQIIAKLPMNSLPPEVATQLKQLMQNAQYALTAGGAGPDQGMAPGSSNAARNPADQIPV